jgi:hypothetical protein
VSVNGFNRVPNPAANIIACFMDAKIRIFSQFSICNPKLFRIFAGRNKNNTTK